MSSRFMDYLIRLLDRSVRIAQGDSGMSSNHRSVPCLMYTVHSAIDMFMYLRRHVRWLQYAQARKR